jgi:hypothetical protein
VVGNGSQCCFEGCGTSVSKGVGGNMVFPNKIVSLKKGNVMSACITRKIILAYSKKDDWGKTDAEALERLFKTDWPKRIGKSFIKYRQASY